MKKIILTAALAISTMSLFAQGSDQLISKKGEMYLPEAGDWSISVSADPFFNYLENIFTTKTAGVTVQPGINFLNGGQTIIGKYYVDNQTAYRGLLRIGINSMNQQNFVTEDGGTSTPPAPLPTVSDMATWSQHFVGLGAGYEKRRGKTRLQGYYGGEFMFFLSGTSNTYTYGNNFSSTYQAPVTTTWGGPNGITPTGSAGASSRTLSTTPGSTFGLSLQGFIGFEWFFMPKVSVGGEYTWGLSFTTTSMGTTSTEVANGTASQTVTTNTGSSGTFSLDSGLNTAWGNATGDLYLCFHF